MSFLTLHDTCCSTSLLMTINNCEKNDIDLEKLDVKEQEEAITILNMRRSSLYIEPTMKVTSEVGS